MANALRTSVCSMQYGNEEFLADLVAEACSEWNYQLMRSSFKWGRRRRRRGGGGGEEMGGD